MSMTPGPWQYDSGDSGQDYSVRYCDVYIDGGNTIIASVNDKIAEGISNAMAIASVPDLIKALLEFVRIDAEDAAGLQCAAGDDLSAALRAAISVLKKAGVEV